VTTPFSERILVKEFLDLGVIKLVTVPFLIAVRWIAGFEDCDPSTLEKWEASEFAIPPYQFKKELGVVTAEGVERFTHAYEREKLHGLNAGHTSTSGSTVFSEP
jgi:hypothetical protein